MDQENQPQTPGQLPPTQMPGQIGPSQSNGLAIASLVLGIIGFMTGLFFGGLLFGLIAVVLGIVAVNKNQSKGMAVTGIALGGISFVTSLGVLLIGISAITSFNSTSDSTQSSADKVNVEEVNFSTYREDDAGVGVDFKYPGEWEKQDTSENFPSGNVLVYDDLTSSGKYLKNRFAYGYAVQTLDEVTDGQRREFADQAVVNGGKFILGDVESLAICEKVEFSSAELFDQANLLGAQYDFECKLVIDGSPVVGHFIVARDVLNVQHQFLFMSSGEELWLENEPLFDEMISSISYVTADELPEGNGEIKVRGGRGSDSN